MDGDVEIFNGIILTDDTRVPFSKKISSKVTVHPVQIRNHPAYNRKGVAKQLTCTEKIAKDEYLGSYGGRISSSDEEWNPYKITPKNCNYDIDGESVGNEMRYINDAKGVGNKEPNVRFFLSYRKLRGHSTVEVISLRDIEVGEEILASYGDGYWEGLEEWYEKQNPYACDECDFRTQNKKSFQSHVLRNHKDRDRYQCQYCDKTFPRSDSLAAHINWHTHDITFECDLCDYTSFSASELYKHKRGKHSNKVKVRSRCPICEKNFTTTSIMEEHVAHAHEGKYNFRCDKCDFRCDRNSRLIDHKRAVHDEGEKLYCKYDNCDFKTGYTGSLRCHIRNVHVRIVRKRERLFSCDKCDKQFTTKGSLQQHTRSTHEGERYSCDVNACCKIYNRPSNLVRHKRLKHSDGDN